MAIINSVQELPAWEKKIFSREQIEQYQKVFSIIEQRQSDNTMAASSTYPHIFQELKKTQF